MTITYKPVIILNATNEKWIAPGNKEYKTRKDAEQASRDYLRKLSIDGVYTPSYEAIERSRFIIATSSKMEPSDSGDVKLINDSVNGNYLVFDSMKAASGWVDTLLDNEISADDTYYFILDADSKDDLAEQCTKAGAYRYVSPAQEHANLEDDRWKKVADDVASEVITDYLENADPASLVEAYIDGRYGSDKGLTNNDANWIAYDHGMGSRVSFTGDQLKQLEKMITEAVNDKLKDSTEE